ncbi:MAG TPA: hypothetical protein VL027_05600 [Spongiibacteraceae bacterium]|jgi:hypothetical protein|nr:hypothetical protein [Spongiibacteraceae bacterium]HUH37401.1 hypothetical protein [Spongiibacteraceae bacterium]
MSLSESVKIRLPSQDLDAPSAFRADPAALAHWLDQLPRANLGQCAKALLQAGSELNRVRLGAETRIALLELLRPVILDVTGQLKRHYLNQPIILPEPSWRAARLCGVLLDNLAAGYTLAGTALDSGNDRRGPLLAACLQRALSVDGVNLLRYSQLYQPAPPGFWRDAHQLYQLANQHGIAQLRVEDRLDRADSPTAAYLRLLLMGAAKTNQLRQSDMSAVYQELGEWSGLAVLSETPAPGALFAFDADADRPPSYQQLLTAPQGASWRFLDTRTLANYVKQQQHPSVSGNLRAHLVLAWSQVSKRIFMRLESTEALDLALGLSTAHHFIGGEIDFGKLTGNDHDSPFIVEKENPFLRSKPVQETLKKDVWDSPYQPNYGLARVSIESIDYHVRTHEPARSDADKPKFVRFPVTSVNASPGGYRLRWPPSRPAALRTGEIIGLREPHHTAWCIAVIRWVRRLDGESVDIGVELLSPSAVPYGARVVQRSGEVGEMHRVLVLPEVKLLCKPTTLITPHVGFREGQKIDLVQRGSETRVQLTRKIAGTGSYSQFEFRRLASIPSARSEPSNGDDFDAIWDIL